MILYDQLRWSPYYNKTNKYLCEELGLGIRQLKEYLNHLEECGYIERNGCGMNRKFTLGQKLINSVERERVLKSYRAEKEPVQGGKGTYDRAEKELHNNNLFKNESKNKNFDNFFLKTQNMEYHKYVQRIKTDIKLGLIQSDFIILDENEWMDK